MSGNYWKKGSWNAICDVCGFKFKSFQLRDRWDGLKVCSGCWEPRHPMDFLKAPKETLNIEWTRPQVTDVFLPVNSYTPYINWVNIFNEGVPNWELGEAV